MSDRRRSRWIAFDSEFFGSTTSGILLDEFGASGVTVWVAYLCACKRNLVPGQISVINDADTLAQLGLSGLPLVDGTGREYTLDALWTRLGRAKKVSRRARGRVTDVICTRWEDWQNESARDIEAARKARSRAGNTGTIPGRNPDDTRTNNDTYIDSYNDNDNDSPRDGGQDPPDGDVVSLLPVGFEAFWTRYPESSRTNKTAARKAWQAARGRGVQEHVILNGLTAWTEHWTTDGTEERFIPHAHNWLSNTRWETRPPKPKRTKGEQKTNELHDVLVSFIEKGGEA